MSETSETQIQTVDPSPSTPQENMLSQREIADAHAIAGALEIVASALDTVDTTARATYNDEPAAELSKRHLVNPRTGNVVGVELNAGTYSITEYKRNQNTKDRHGDDTGHPKGVRKLVVDGKTGEVGRRESLPDALAIDQFNAELAGSVAVDEKVSQQLLNSSEEADEKNDSLRRAIKKIAGEAQAQEGATRVLTLDAVEKRATKIRRWDTMTAAIGGVVVAAAILGGASYLSSSQESPAATSHSTSDRQYDGYDQNGLAVHYSGETRAPGIYDENGLPVDPSAMPKPGEVQTIVNPPLDRPAPVHRAEDMPGVPSLFP